MKQGVIVFSVFILMKGATKKRAFQVANEIVDTITKMNPQPMKLKFEKVIDSSLSCCSRNKSYQGWHLESLTTLRTEFSPNMLLRGDYSPL